MVRWEIVSSWLVL